MNKYALLIFLAISPVFAEIPYTILDSSYVQRGKEIEISPQSPIKSQDGIGLCYGFSATSLLENYRCRELNLDCNNPNEILSSLDVTSYYERKRLVEGGETFRILSNIERSAKKVARESCIKFSTLVHQMNTSQNKPIKDEKRGWIFLTKKWNEYKGLGGEKRNDCVSCLADSIKNTLASIETPADQIKNAFTDAHSLEEFLYKVLLPSQCMQENQMAEIPPYVSKTYPGYNEKFSEDALSSKIQTILSNGLPLELGICTSGTRPCANNAGHSIALFGLKEVCSQKNNECRKLVKVKNSYGMNWQLMNNDGWVDLQTLVEASHLLGERNNISWIQSPGFVLREVRENTPAPQYSAPSSRATTPPEEYKNYHGTWKCPNNTYQGNYEPGCVPMRR